VGTTSVERSEYLSELLTKRGVKHNVLNAKYHEEEGNIVARAGRPGNVTVATNMAGRGTDIVLGGNPEVILDIGTTASHVGSNMAGRGTDIVLGGNPEVILDMKLRERGLDPFDDEEKYQE